MLEMHGITKSFDAVKALKGASLSVKPGEIRALLGANGSGKSTMVKVLAGLVKPDGGEITIDAKPVHIHSSRDSAQLGIATAFQDLSLIPTMSVLDNIKLGRETVRRTGTIDAKKDRRDVEDLLARFHLKCDPDAYAQTLMPSTQSMLEVAKAVFARPRLLLLDEVTATLHQDEIEVLFQILQELKAEGEPVLAVKDLKYSPKVWGIDLEAYRGEIVGISGLDGQGQSEFIRLLLGEFHAESGTIVYRGKETAFKNPAEAVANDVGFISGERNREAIFDRRTISENLYVGASARGGLFRFIPNRKIQEFSRKAVEKYNIKIGRIDDPASSLSGGNQQKLVVARWIAQMPDLLLLDDPTKGVDINSRREIHQILRECARQGMTVVVSSSDNDELMDLADRIYVFYEGRVSAMLSGESKTQERLVAEMMGVSRKGGSENA